MTVIAENCLELAERLDLAFKEAPATFHMANFGIESGYTQRHASSTAKCVGGWACYHWYDEFQQSSMSNWLFATIKLGVSSYAFFPAASLAEQWAIDKTDGRPIQFYDHVTAQDGASYLRMIAQMQDPRCAWIETCRMVAARINNDN